jgi:hypothetical protein
LLGATSVPSCSTSVPKFFFDPRVDTTALVHISCLTGSVPSYLGQYLVTIPVRELK